MACGSRVIPSHSGIAVWRRHHRTSGGYVAHIQGTQKCGSVWACPVCSPKIRQQRAADLDRGALRWLQEHGTLSVGLLTLTIPHSEEHSLEQVFGVLRTAFGSLLAGRSWQSVKGRWALAHYVRAYDLTVGKNGWHPHIHAVLFFERPPAEADLTAIEDDLYSRWKAAVLSYDYERPFMPGERASWWRAPTREHGLQLELARSRGDVARYVCQVIGEHDAEDMPWGMAQEVMRADLKRSRHDGHRSPWQLLGDIAQLGEYADVSQWREYEQATKGVQAVRWSKGLRRAVGLMGDVSNSAAAELLDGKPEDYGEPELVAVIAPDLWRWGRRSPPEVARLLTLAELGGERAVLRQLDLWRDRMLWEQEAKAGTLAEGGLDDLGYAADTS
jgi:hypothetical protein